MKARSDNDPSFRTGWSMQELKKKNKKQARWPDVTLREPDSDSTPVNAHSLLRLATTRPKEAVRGALNASFSGLCPDHFNFERTRRIRRRGILVSCSSFLENDLGS